MVDALRPEFDGRVAFVLVDLHTAEGRAFAARYGVPNTTLVFFDAAGARIATFTGVQEEDVLRARIRGSFGL